MLQYRVVAVSFQVPLFETCWNKGPLRPRHEVRMYPLFLEVSLSLNTWCSKTLGNLELSTSKLLSDALRRIYARVTATNLFIQNHMSNNIMSFTEPVPLGT